MTTKQAVVDVLKERRMTQADLASKAGYSAQSSISTSLNRSAMQIDTLLRFLDALDCEIVIRDKSKYHKEWIIDRP